jgi:hypothetical protein
MSGRAGAADGRAFEDIVLSVVCWDDDAVPDILTGILNYWRVWPAVVTFPDGGKLFAMSMLTLLPAVDPVLESDLISSEGVFLCDVASPWGEADFRSPPPPSKFSRECYALWDKFGPCLVVPVDRFGQLYPRASETLYEIQRLLHKHACWTHQFSTSPVFRFLLGLYNLAGRRLRKSRQNAAAVRERVQRLQKEREGTTAMHDYIYTSFLNQTGYKTAHGQTRTNARVAATKGLGT